MPESREWLLTLSVNFFSPVSPGKSSMQRPRRLSARIQPGGFILFGRNIRRSPAQLRKLIDDLRDLSSIEPIITIDQEGGRVSRLKLIGHEPPNANQLRDRGDLGLILQHGKITGQLLRIFGFNLDLCPVLDISFDDEADNSLRGRCYGSSDVAQVIRNATAFNDGLHAEGILSLRQTFSWLLPRRPSMRITNSRPFNVPARSWSATSLAVFRNFSGKIDSMMIGHRFLSGPRPS